MKLNKLIYQMYKKELWFMALFPIPKIYAIKRLLELRK